MNAFIGALHKLTTPLLPEDYLTMLNPLWHSAELRGRIVAVRSETAEASTIVIRTAREYPAHIPGQYLRIGVDIDGVRHWRSYSITSVPDAGDLISITVKRTEFGLVSRHLTSPRRVGDLVRLEPPAGEFTVGRDVAPQRLLFIAAGSGVTPVLSMLTALAAEPRPPKTDLIAISRYAETMIFGAKLRELAASSSWLTLHERWTAADGRIRMDDLDSVVPAWRISRAFVCGPSSLLDDAEAHWAGCGIEDQLMIERFQAQALTSDGEGGEVRFIKTGTRADADANTTLLAAGEAAGVLMPSGCRMGICRTCVVPLSAGQVRDVRTNEIHSTPGQHIQTCVSAPICDVELDV